MNALTITNNSVKEIYEVNLPVIKSVVKLKYGSQVVWPEDDTHGPFWLDAEDECELKMFYGVLAYKYDHGADWTYLYEGSPTLIHFGGSMGRIYLRQLIPSSFVGFFETAHTTFFSAGGRLMALRGDDEDEAHHLGWYELFYGAQHLVDASELRFPTTHPFMAYRMFQGCIHLVNPPALPSMHLTEACYQHMFKDCTSLTTVPELPATTVPNYAYCGMFEGCTSIKEMNSFGATFIGEYGCGQMFWGCTELEHVCDFNIQSIELGGCDSMFEDCRRLQEMPSFTSVNVVGPAAFRQTFENCTSLTRADKLCHLTGGASAYDETFYGCSNLTYVDMGPGNVGFESMWSTFKGCPITEFHWHATKVDCAEWSWHPEWWFGMVRASHGYDQGGILANELPDHIDIYVPAGIELLGDTAVGGTHDESEFIRFLFYNYDPSKVTWHYV